VASEKELKGRPGPACVVWELTLACNLKCLHCGSTAGGRRAAELGPEEALRLCVDLAAAGTRGVALMGGEPLLRPDFLPIARRVRELGMELSVITNGTVVPAGIFAELAALRPRAVAVSLDAASPELHDRIRGSAGAFAKTRDFMERCLAAGLPLSVITTVHKLNLKELPALRELLRGRGIAWQVQTAGAEGGRFAGELLLSPEEFYSVGMFVEACRRDLRPEELAVIGAHDLGYHSLLLHNVSLYDKWEGCQAGTAVAGLRSDGTVLGCLAINDGRYAEGNVRERSFAEIWNSPGAFKYTRGFSPADLGPGCSGCEHGRACRGGCSEMSLMKTGRLHNDPYCFFRIEKELFPGELPGPAARLLRRLAGRGPLAALARRFGGR